MHFILVTGGWTEFEVGAYFELIVRLYDAYLRLNACKMKCCKAENAQDSK